MRTTIHRFIFVFVLVFMAFLPSIDAQSGCTDPLANNYNTAAITNNGSCTYNPTNYIPVLKVNPLNGALIETSGLQFIEGFLWTFNDSGGEPVLYCIDTITNAILQSVTLGGATNTDWEDISYDGIHVYVGDFGNNINGGRTNLRIYKFPFSSIPDRLSNPMATIPAADIEVIQFTWSDQPQPPVTVAPQTTRFDCEAMIVDAGKIHLFTKNFGEQNTVHYEISPITAGNRVAMPVDTFPTNYLVTGADKMPGENIIVLLGYVVPNPFAGNFGNHFITILSDYPATHYFSGNKRTLNLPNVLTMGQAEGIAFRNNRYGYISNEAVNQSGLNIPSQLKAFDIRSFITETILSFELKAFSVTSKNNDDLLSWEFDRRIFELELQQSGDAISFKTIYQTPASKSGNQRVQSSRGTDFYRLKWLDASGSEQYSQVLQTNAKGLQKINNISANRQGKLVFTLQGTDVSRVGFEMLSTDGKRIGSLAPSFYSPGIHQVYFPGFLGSQSLVFLRILNQEVSQTQPVWVQ